MEVVIVLVWEASSFLKLMTSLISLTIHNALLALSLRYATTRSRSIFHATTAVLMTEIAKFFICLLLVYFDEGSFSKWRNSLYRTVIQKPFDTLRVAVVAIFYVIKDNLLYLSAANLDATTNQVTYQLRILTTAVFAVVLMKRRLGAQQWMALLVLLIGIVLVQITKSTDKIGKDNPDQNRLIGIAAVLGACCLSGFAGIHFEIILKSSDNISVWIRYVQLSCLSMPVALVTCFLTDYDKIIDNGFFFGYDIFVIYLVFLQAGGGLIVAVVVKYGDNILKGFATSAAIVISAVFSVYLFGFEISSEFVLGAILVVLSIIMYNVNTVQKDSVVQQDTIANDIV
ncbi:UDP-galactose/UDP-N-acetylglucosamine transporter srf-3-like isoform X2 [Nilaparvata lugens]|uniref:UDP-galactose/UDP-N-acetylglucosamine transporter srf-3-like isoform X2 n=1 Tax=Nilaparvata lugens TaxID=108931 RepID=UPI00193CA611|nr:UDP-galactose/UDP-N-acetylglucosamine transporter srf-3-like isoform X2 [Nilaparvata lugens]